MVVMMVIEISCKGQCEKLSHFPDLVSHTDLLLFYASVWYICDFFQFHIEIEGKCGWIIGGGGGAKGMLSPPSQIIGGGLPPPPPLPPPSSYAYLSVYVSIYLSIHTLSHS